MTPGTMESKKRPARILLVEDNQGDIILTKRAFKEAKMANELIIATSGEEAIRILRNDEGLTPPPRPDLILLDLNLPQMSGQDVLQIVKNSPELRTIPVVILSSSSAEQDVLKVYNLHSNGYITKPVALEGFKAVIQKIEAFWFTLNVFPDDERT